MWAAIFLFVFLFEGIVYSKILFILWEESQGCHFLIWNPRDHTDDRVQSYLAKATEPSDLDLVQFNADSLVLFEGSWRYEWLWRFSSYVFLDAKQMIHILEFNFSNCRIPVAHWFGLLCHANCQFTVMASLKCKEVEKGMCDPEKCKNSSNIRHNLPMSRSREFWIQ